MGSEVPLILGQSHSGSDGAPTQSLYPTPHPLPPHPLSPPLTTPPHIPPPPYRLPPPGPVLPQGERPGDGVWAPRRCDRPLAPGTLGPEPRVSGETTVKVKSFYLFQERTREVDLDISYENRQTENRTR